MARRPHDTMAGVALLAALLCLIAACGDAGDQTITGAEGGLAEARPAGDRARRDKALEWAGDPSTQVIVLDMDRLGSPQAALERAVQARDALGDAERVVVLVRAHRPADAEVGVELLAAQGFEWVAPVWSPNWQRGRHIRRFGDVTDASRNAPVSMSGGVDLP
jgi:hypothetical protein